MLFYCQYRSLRNQIQWNLKQNAKHFIECLENIVCKMPVTLMRSQHYTYVTWALHGHPNHWQIRLFVQQLVQTGDNLKITPTSNITCSLWFPSQRASNADSVSMFVVVSSWMIAGAPSSLAGLLSQSPRPAKKTQINPKEISCDLLGQWRINMSLCVRNTTFSPEKLCIPREYCFTQYYVWNKLDCN